jgi:hypothetical protein
LLVLTNPAPPIILALAERRVGFVVGMARRTMRLFGIYGAVAETSTCIFTLSDSFQVLWIDTCPIMATAFSDVIHHKAGWNVANKQFVGCPVSQHAMSCAHFKPAISGGRPAPI